MAIKKPKTKFDLSVSKVPKNIEDPAHYKTWPVSWQISHIDRESKWGYSAFQNHVKFKFDESLVNKLPVDLDSTVYDALTDLNAQEFKTIEHFILKLSAKCGPALTTEIQNYIYTSFEENIFWREIYTKLRHFESTSWNEIEKEQYGSRGKTKHHSVSVSKIIPLAQDRLAKLGIEDIDEVFSIRLAGELRIWGIRHFSFLRILWFDLYHEICPVSRN